MSRAVRGVIARSSGAPVEVCDIIVPDPGPGEARVTVEACGVCHTDLHYREGGISDEFPFLLGHEAAGRVEAVGEDVTEVAPGDFVVLNWRAVCGQCRACAKGRPQYCFNTHNAAQPMTLADGTALSPALGLGAFAEATLVAAGQCTKVNPRADAAVAGLLGCGVMAGFGAAVHTGGVTRGDSVAVFGCGGVGDAAIAGAALAGATTIIAVDRDPTKLEWASGFGATHTVDASSVDPVEAIRHVTGGFGADVVVEAVGHPEVLKQAFYARDLAGTVVQVGVPTPDMAMPELPMIDFFGRGGALKPSWYGDCLPSRDFPELVDLHLQGRFPLDAFVSERIGIDGVEEAFAKMQRGEVLRSVVVL
ncbi:MAG: S-(hydroxymethyl)mycothiol dehydrogenase [Microthrixaceae bacterium]